MDYNWPVDLKLDAAGVSALEQVPQRHPILAEWPEGEKFLACPQAQDIAIVLIPFFHPELKNATIKYLFQEDMAGRNKVVLGKAMRAPARWGWLTGIDFVLTFNYTTWKDLNIPQRAALVDHELEHCFVEETQQGPTMVVHPHDLEEFNTIVRRWGMWRSSVANFLDAAKPQLELLPVEK